MNKEQETSLPDLTFEEVVRLTQEQTLRHGGHLPTLIIDSSKQILAGLIPSLAETEKERIQQMFQTGINIAQTNIAGELRQVFFIHQSWISKTHDNKPIVTFSLKYPESQEVLTISTLSIENQAQRLIIVLFKMLRNTEGKLTELREIQHLENRNNSMSYDPLLSAFVNGFQFGSASRSHQ